MLTLAEEPYGELSAFDVYRSEQEIQLPQPLKCPSALYLVLQQCWQKESVTRPAFADLTGYMEEAGRILARSGGGGAVTAAAAETALDALRSKVEQGMKEQQEERQRQAETAVPERSHRRASELNRLFKTGVGLKP